LWLTALLCTGSAACGTVVAASYPLTPLATAARAGDLDAIDRLLSAGAPVNQGSGVNGWSPAMHAIHKNQFAALGRLLDHGASLSGSAGQNAMQMAAGYGDVDTVRTLLAHDVTPPDDILDSAVGGAWDIDYRWSGCARHMAVTRALLEKHPRLRVPNSLGGRIARSWARWKGCGELVRLVS
jgi:hypothetical protein